jgi:hypothetical protein
MHVGTSMTYRGIDYSVQPVAPGVRGCNGDIERRRAASGIGVA